MVQLGGVPLSALILLLVVTDAGFCLARSFARDDEYWINDVNKRNSWWTKKSVESPLAPSEEATTPDENGRTNFSRQVYECYTGTCVPEFIKCARALPGQRGYQGCVASHRVCAEQCWTLASAGVL